MIGYVVILDDANATDGFWYVGIYKDDATARLAMGKQHAKCRVEVMTAPTGADIDAVMHAVNKLVEPAALEDPTGFDDWQTFGKVQAVRAAVYGAIKGATAAEREACLSICRDVAGRYPEEVFPEDGESLDCKSARMARLTATNIIREITER